MRRFIWFISTIFALLGLLLASMLERARSLWNPAGDNVPESLDWWEA